MLLVHLLLSLTFFTLFPDTEVLVHAQVIQVWKIRALPLTEDEREALWRMSVKAHWHEADSSAAQDQAEARIKMLTEKDRLALSLGGPEDGAYPSAPFTITSRDNRPASMPTGTPFEIEIESLGDSMGNGSLGWDGRFENQPDGHMDMKSSSPKARWNCR